MAQHVMQVTGNALSLGDLGQVLSFFLRHQQLLVVQPALPEMYVDGANQQRKNRGRNPKVG